MPMRLPSTALTSAIDSLPPACWFLLFVVFWGCGFFFSGRGGGRGKEARNQSPSLLSSHHIRINHVGRDGRRHARHDDDPLGKRVRQPSARAQRPADAPPDQRGHPQRHPLHEHVRRQIGGRACQDRSFEAAAADEEDEDDGGHANAPLGADPATFCSQLRQSGGKRHRQQQGDQEPLAAAGGEEAVEEGRCCCSSWACAAAAGGGGRWCCCWCHRRRRRCCRRHGRRRGRGRCCRHRRCCLRRRHALFLLRSAGIDARRWQVAGVGLGEEGRGCGDGAERRGGAMTHS